MFKFKTVKKLHLFIPVFFVFLFCFSIFPIISKSVYYAEDSVYIYEYGKRIYDNSFIFVTDGSYSYSKRCGNGLCLVGQQYIPVTIYKTKNNNTLTFFEFESQHPKDYYSGEPIDRNMRDSENYLEYLKQNSYYSASFDPGSSEGGEGCGFSGCWGGRIGDNRSFVLNVNNGNYKQIAVEPGEYFLGGILSRNIVIYLSIFISFLILIFCLKIKRKNNKVKTGRSGKFRV